MKTLLKSIRRHVERFIFCALFRRIHGNPLDWSETQIRRYNAYQASGLDFARKCWWNQWTLEPWFNIWRYVFLLEWASWKPLRAAPSPAEKRILVIKLEHLGDTLHAFPMLEALRKCEPTARIDVLVGPWCESLVSRLTCVDHVMVYNPSMTQMNRGSHAQRLRFKEERSFLNSLYEANYDLVMNAGTGGPVDWALLKFISARRSVGHYVIKPDLWPLDGDDRTRRYSIHTYEAYRVSGLLNDAGYGEIMRVPLFLPLSGKEEEFALHYLEKLGLPGNQWIAMAPGAGWPGKEWPEEYFAELAHKLTSEEMLPVLLFGSSQEIDLCRRVADRFNNDVQSVAGDTSYTQAAALIKHAALYIGNDAGLLHAAVAVGTPTVSLFGPTHPEQWAPEGENHRHIKSQEVCPDCRPWHPNSKCSADRKCMRAISVQFVFDMAKELLATKGQAR